MIRVCAALILPLLFLTSCALNKPTFVHVEKDEKNQYTHVSERWKPKYQANGGWKKSTIFNSKKVESEARFKELLDKWPTPKPPNPPINESNEPEVDIAKRKAVEQYNQKLYELEDKLSQIDINKKGVEEDYENLLIEMNNLICNYQEGLTLLEKKVQRLFGDVSFQTGSAEISGNGKKTIKGISESVKEEVKRWKVYVNSCNKKIFENDLFVVVINIDGFADQRGSEPSNLALSQKRAKTVEKVLRNELASLVKGENVRIVFDRIYVEGHGEKLPPDVSQGPENDPNRRVCLISYIVGPARYLGD